MNRNATAIIGLAILMGGYAFHARSAFILYHVFKVASMLLGTHH